MQLMNCGELVACLSVYPRCAQVAVRGQRLAHLARARGFADAKLVQLSAQARAH